MPHRFGLTVRGRVDGRAETGPLCFGFLSPVYVCVYQRRRSDKLRSVVLMKSRAPHTHVVSPKKLLLVNRELRRLDLILCFGWPASRGLIVRNTNNNRQVVLSKLEITVW